MTLSRLRRTLRAWGRLLAEGFAECPPRPGHPTSVIRFYESSARTASTAGRSTGGANSDAPKHAR